MMRSIAGNMAPQVDRSKLSDLQSIPKPLTELQQEMGTLDTEVVELQNLANDLEKKLQPVLSPVSPDMCCDGVAILEPVTEMGISLRKITCQVLSIQGAVRSILARCAV